MLTWNLHKANKQKWNKEQSRSKPGSERKLRKKMTRSVFFLLRRCEMHFHLCANMSGNEDALGICFTSCWVFESAFDCSNWLSPSILYSIAIRLSRHLIYSPSFRHQDWSSPSNSGYTFGLDELKGRERLVDEWCVVVVRKTSSQPIYSIQTIQHSSKSLYHAWLGRSYTNAR